MLPGRKCSCRPLDLVKMAARFRAQIRIRTRPSGSRCRRASHRLVTSSQPWPFPPFSDPRSRKGLSTWLPTCSVSDIILITVVPVPLVTIFSDERGMLGRTSGRPVVVVVVIVVVVGMWYGIVTVAMPITNAPRDVSIISMPQGNSLVCQFSGLACADVLIFDWLGPSKA